LKTAAESVPNGGVSKESDFGAFRGSYKLASTYSQRRGLSALLYCSALKGDTSCVVILFLGRAGSYAAFGRAGGAAGAQTSCPSSATFWSSGIESSSEFCWGGV